MSLAPSKKGRMELFSILQNALFNTAIVTHERDHWSLVTRQQGKYSANKETTQKGSITSKEKICLNTLERKEKRRSKMKKDSRQTQSYTKSQEESQSDEKQSEKENYESSNILKTLPNYRTPSGYLISKSQSKHLQIFTCFLCFLSNSQDCMWDNSQQYLAHMLSFHKVLLDFEDILKNRAHNFSGSHILFKRKLTNIFSNTRQQGEFKLYYQLKKQLFHQLFFCSCKPSLRKIYLHSSSPTFNSEKQYISHLKSHSHKYKVLSHELKQQGLTIYLRKNSNFDVSLIIKKVKRCQNMLKEVIKQRIKMFQMFRILKKIPLNVLQIVSCNPKLLPYQKVSVNYPRCQSCSQFFMRSSSLSEHKNKVCTQIHHENKFQVTRDELKQLGLFKQEKSKFKVRNIFQLAEDDYLILNTHISLLSKNKCFRNWKALICGHCKAAFSHYNDPYFDYLLHIYLNHQTLHPLNSHYITFIQKLPREMYESKKEEQEEDNEQKN